MAILDQWGQPIPRKPPEVPRSVLALHDRWQENVSKGLTPERLTAILREAEEGDLWRQAQLMEDMEERDPFLFSLLQTRKLAVVSLDWRIEPADTSAEARRYAEAFGLVWDNLPREELLVDLMDAVGKGVSRLAQAWTRDDGLWVPGGYRWLHLKHQVYRPEEDRFLISTPENPMGVPLPFGAAVEHRYKARSGSPTRAGLLRTLAWMYLFANYAIKDWVVYAEVYGQPYRLGKYDPSTGTDEREALERAVASLGSDAAGIISKDTEIEILEAAHRGGPEVYERLVRIAHRLMAQAILGQTLTSSEGEHGTQALGKVHERVRLDLLRADVRALALTLRRDVAQPFVAFNWGPEAIRRAPRLVPQIREEEDLKAKAETLGTLAEQLGMRIPESWAHEQFGVPLPNEGERVLGARPQPSPAPLELSRISLSAPLPPGVLDGQGFVSGLIERSVDAGGAGLERLLERLLRAIESADGYDEARAALLRLFPDLDPAALQQLLEAGLILSQLAGRYAQRQGER